MHVISTLHSNSSSYPIPFRDLFILNSILFISAIKMKSLVKLKFLSKERIESVMRIKF